MDRRGAVVLGGAHGALALARSLGPSGVPVVQITNDSPLPGWSRHVQRQIAWPGPHDDNAVAFLLKVAKEEGWDSDLLVPAGDAEVELVSRHIDTLATAYTIALPDWDALKWVCEKPLLYRRSAELGIATPRTYEPAGGALLEGFDLGFPVVLKPNMGGGDTAIAKAKVIRADDRAALERAYKDAVAEIGAENVVVQELIPGGGEHQFSYAALWDRGNPVAEFTARRTRQFPVDFGYTSTFVEIVDEPGVADAARTLLGSIGHYGLVEVEFKRDHRDGALRLLDVNPRPWSWFGLCSAAGMDLGTMLWQLADGQPTGPATARPGTAWMYLARDAVAASSLIARKELNVSGYLRSFRQVRAWATFALNDPKPSLIDLPLTSWRVLTRRILISAPSQPKRMGADKTVLPATAQRLVKNGLIWTGLEAVTLPGVQSIFPSSGGRGMIFTLHHVRPERKGAKLSPNALLSITPEFLEQAIETALESGLTPVHLHDLPALLADPGDNRRFVAFTLDDGYRNNAEFAAPIFGRYGIPYTIFINPGFVERTRTMWWETAAAIARKADLIDFDFGNGPESLRTTTTARKFAAFERFAAFVQSIDEDEAVARIDAVARDRHNIDPMAIVDSLVMDEAELRELARDPLVHLGAHTMTHVNLRRVSRERLKDEIEQSAATVQAYVERRPLSFAYPYGWTTAVGGREAKAVADAGFAAAVTTQPGVLDAACLDHPMALPRVSLNGLYQKKRYVRALLSGLPFKLM